MVRNLIIIGLLVLGVATDADAARRTRARRSSGGGYSSTTIGPLFGFSVDPDQIVGGLQISAPFARNWTVNPSINLGFGDNVTVTTINFDAEYHFRVQGSSWNPYAGLGVGINYYNYTSSTPFYDTSDTVSGLNIVLGTRMPAAARQNIFTEVRLGTGDSTPQLKGIIGWNFRM